MKRHWVHIIFMSSALLLCNSAKAQMPDVAFHTNTLYDAFVIPNLGIDIDLGNRWTAGVNWHHAWWTDKLFYWKQTYGGDIHVDRHLDSENVESPFEGHRLGAYGQLLTYDFEFQADGQMADKPNFALGIEYGYSFPLSRKLYMDFSLGVGYLWGKYKKYTPMWNDYPPEWHYVWQSTHRRNMFCVTKVEISLVWYLKKKGGQK